MTTALVPRAPKEDILALDRFAREARNELAVAQREGNSLYCALMTSRMIQTLRTMLTPEILADMMALQNSVLGFLTDRDPNQIDKKTGKPYEPYNEDVVRDALLVANVWGARPFGNEINILARRPYRTVNFFRRRVREQPGVKDLVIQVGAPEYFEQGAKARVPAVASWVQDGKPARRVCGKDASGDWRISVKVNYGMGEDAVKGKAERKLLALVLADMEGRPVDDADANDPDDPHVIDGVVAQTVVVPEQESVGDDIAADAAQHVHEQTPAPASEDPRKAEFLAIMRQKRGPKAVAAWVAHCATQGVDIADEADAFLKEQKLAA